MRKYWDNTGKLPEKNMEITGKVKRKYWKSLKKVQEKKRERT